MRAACVLLALAAVALAGCVRPEALAPQEERAPDAPPAVPSPAPQRENATGALLVRALFTDRSPLAGAHVTVGNASRATGPDGEATFDGLPAGFHVVQATKEAHRAAQAGVDVRPGERAVVEVTLEPESGGKHEHKVGFDAHRDVYRFDGHFDCSATYLIITGDCLIVVENVTSSRGLPDPTRNVTTERNVIDFPLDLSWAALVVELDWSKGQGTPYVGDGMTLALEPAEAPADGHAAKYARVTGGTPLRIELLPGVKHATATQDDMPNPLGGEVIRARAFVAGAGHNAGGLGFLGVGAAKDHRFTLHVSIFYGQAAPQGYTAIE